MFMAAARFGCESGVEHAEGAARRGGTKYRGRFDEAALHEIDPNITQPVEVLLMLDLLRYDAKVHRTRELDHCCDHFPVDLVGNQISRVDAVDF